MTVVLVPDVEQLVSGFLRDQPEVADLVADRVYTEIPTLKANTAEWRWPLMRVTRFGGRPAFTPLHLDAAEMQFDCFGGPKRTAWVIAETCRYLLDRRLPGGHDEGVVTGVDIGRLSWAPDGTFTPAKPRYLFTATVYVRPHPDLLGS